MNGIEIISTPGFLNSLHILNITKKKYDPFKQRVKYKT